MVNAVSITRGGEISKKFDLTDSVYSVDGDMLAWCTSAE